MRSEIAEHGGFLKNGFRRFPPMPGMWRTFPACLLAQAADLQVRIVPMGTTVLRVDSILTTNDEQARENAEWRSGRWDLARAHAEDLDQ
jgi:hypothetical protein